MRVLPTIGLNTLTAEHPHPDNDTANNDTNGAGASGSSHGSADDFSGRGGSDQPASSATGNGGITGGRTVGGDGAALPRSLEGTPQHRGKSTGAG